LLVRVDHGLNNTSPSNVIKWPFTKIERFIIAPVANISIQRQTRAPPTV
jgi:hypothetical protein